MSHRKIFTVSGVTLAGALIGILLAGCVSRDNPWDPVNYRGNVPTDCDVADAARRADSLNVQVGRTCDSLVVLRQIVDSLQKRNSLDSIALIHSVLRPNSLVLESNRIIAIINDSLVTANATLPLSQAQNQRYQDTIVSISPLRPRGDYSAEINKMRQLAATVQATRITGDLLCDPESPFDSVGAAAVSDSTTALLVLTESFSRTLADYVAIVNDSLVPTVAGINTTVRAYNDSARAYNERLSFAVAFAEHPVINNADTLAARILAVAPGDTIVLAGGTLSGSFHFPQRGSLTRPILVTGQPDHTTVLANGSMLLDSIGSVNFQYITFYQNVSAGVKLVNASSPIRFTNCDFSDNAGDGLEISDCDVYLTNCRIMGNSGNGVQTNAAPLSGRILSLDNCLIAGNRIAGIKTVGCALSIHNATLADNAQHGINAPNPQLDITLYGSIVAFNTGYGVFFNPLYESARSLALLQIDFFNNTSGDINDIPTGSFTILRDDPAFADRFSGDYSVSGGPIYDLEKQGIVVGYRP